MGINSINQRNFQALFPASNRDDSIVANPKIFDEATEVKPLRDATVLEKIAFGDDGVLLGTLKWAFAVAYKLGIEPAIAFFSGEGQRLDADFNEMRSIGIDEAKSAAKVIREFNSNFNHSNLTSILDNLRQGNQEATVKIMGDDKASIGVKYGAVVLIKKNEDGIQQEDEVLMPLEEFLPTLMNSVLKDTLERSWTNLKSSNPLKREFSTLDIFVTCLVKSIKATNNSTLQLLQSLQPEPMRPVEISKRVEPKVEQPKSAETNKPKLEKIKPEVQHPVFEDGDDESSDEGNVKRSRAGFWSWFSNMFGRTETPSNISAN